MSVGFAGFYSKWLLAAKKKTGKYACLANNPITGINLSYHFEALVSVAIPSIALNTFS